MGALEDSERTIMGFQTIGGEKIAVGGEQTADDTSRMLRARLDLMVASMPTAVWINPCLAIFWTLPFVGIFPVLGTTPWPRLGVIMILQVASSIGALVIGRGYKRNSNDSKRWLNRLSFYQAATGAGWGLFAWLIWSDGNTLNNVLVTMTVCGIVWAYSFSRSMHVGVFLAGILPIVALTIGRIVLTGGNIAVALILITAINCLLAYIFAFGFRRQVEVMLRMRFANDDLAVELRDTRDEALRKRFEAEAANASKTKFLANMSHELRTPLNAVLGFSEIIAAEALGPVGTERYREYARDINSSGAHLLSLINDILDIAKIESGKMEIVPRFIDPKAAIESALDIVLPRVREKKQTLTVDIESGGGGVFSDDRAFKQIIINLLSNAVKFTQDGGHIKISLRRTANDGCELCVSDDGPGIPAALFEQVFMPFNQLDNRYSRQVGGTGLGLSLVRGLAELHGGRAWIESNTGTGVRAFVYLPGGRREGEYLRRA